MKYVYYGYYVRCQLNLQLDPRGTSLYFVYIPSQWKGLQDVIREEKAEEDNH